jgi:hypothetical protein
MVKIIWWVEKSGSRMIITFYGVDFFWQFSMSFLIEGTGFFE